MVTDGYFIVSGLFPRSVVATLPSKRVLRLLHINPPAIIMFVPLLILTQSHARLFIRQATSFIMLDSFP